MTKSNGRGWLKVTLQLLLFVAIIGGGWVSANYFIDTKPTARRSRPEKLSPLVDIAPTRSTSKTVVVNAMGTVVPARQISLYSQLVGTVDWISPKFVPGGRIAQGEVLVKLNREDYELAARKQRSVIRQLQADLALEKGKQAVARKEIELMKKTLGKTIKDPRLALRVPQLNKAMASLKSQEIGLEQALLDLKRTVIKAPFNAMVLDRSIELGSRVTTQNGLATLIGTDAFWIEAAVPVDKLQWIGIPGSNGNGSSQVRVRLQDGSKTTGRVIRLLGDLTSKSQMARLLVQVDDPLGMNRRSGQMPLLLNSYVSLDFVGSRIQNVVEIPRKVVKDGNRIWILEKGQLRIRTIQPVWEDEESFYVRNTIKPGELLITSEMTAAVDGMTVRTLDADKATVEKVDPKKQKPADNSNGKMAKISNSQES
ncbi:MAG: HlyD family efflux transporter periplasmic adaptor subunit [bacterium]